MTWRARAFAAVVPCGKINVSDEKQNVHLSGGGGEEERELDVRGCRRFLTGIIHTRPAVTYTCVTDKSGTRKSDGKGNVEIEIDRGIVYVYIRIKFAKCHSPRRLLYIDYLCVINLCRSKTIHTRVTYARVL